MKRFRVQRWEIQRMTNMSSFCLIQADKDSIVEFGDFPCFALLTEDQSEPPACRSLTSSRDNQSFDFSILKLQPTVLSHYKTPSHPEGRGSLGLGLSTPPESDLSRHDPSSSSTTNKPADDLVWISFGASKTTRTWLGFLRSIW